MAPHHRYVTALGGYSHILWCGLLSLSATKAMREASLKGKDSKFPHLIYYINKLSSGDWGAEDL